MRWGELVGAFARQTRGNVAIVVAFLFVPLAVIAGGATDIARYESYRAKLQDGVDRGVLAAVSMTQTKAAQDTVINYLKSVSFNDEITVTVLADQKTTNTKTVTVRANYLMETAFLPLIGIDTMDVVAEATASVGRQDVEISLMLDFSGSMNDDGKYPSLKTAATGFIDAILTPDTKKFTSVNVVPYAGQVNVGSAMFGWLGGVRVHNDSSCLRIYNADFGKGLVDLTGRPQIPQFTRWNSTVDKPVMPANMGPGWCPSESNAMVMLSNDAAYLKARIAGFQMYDGTGSGIAMNWGMMLLDPAAQTLTAKAIEAGMVSSDFASRPAPFGSDETLKVLVLMTDGIITEQYTAINPTLPVGAPDNFVDVYDPVGNVLQTREVTAAQLATVCTQAKAKGAVVFTIGFRLDATGREQMRRCASTSSHFYDVQSLDIATAFRSIASAIQKIKLTR